MKLSSELYVVFITFYSETLQISPSVCLGWLLTVTNLFVPLPYILIAKQTARTSKTTSSPVINNCCLIGL